MTNLNENSSTCPFGQVKSGAGEKLHRKLAGKSFADGDLTAERLSISLHLKDLFAPLCNALATKLKTMPACDIRERVSKFTTRSTSLPYPPDHFFVPERSDSAYLIPSYRSLLCQPRVLPKLLDALDKILATDKPNPGHHRPTAEYWHYLAELKIRPESIDHWVSMQAERNVSVPQSLLLAQQAKIIEVLQCMGSLDLTPNLAEAFSAVLDLRRTSQRFRSSPLMADSATFKHFVLDNSELDPKFAALSSVMIPVRVPVGAYGEEHAFTLTRLIKFGMQIAIEVGSRDADLRLARYGGLISETGRGRFIESPGADKLIEAPSMTLAEGVSSIGDALSLLMAERVSGVTSISSGLNTLSRQINYIAQVTPPGVIGPAILHGRFFPGILVEGKYGQVELEPKFVVKVIELRDEFRQEPSRGVASVKTVTGNGCPVANGIDLVELIEALAYVAEVLEGT